MTISIIKVQTGMVSKTIEAIEETNSVPCTTEMAV